MKILAIETSCDETAAAVIQKKENTSCVTIFSNVLSSSLKLHAKTGGIIPEIAAREQIKYIIPIIQKALEESNYSEKDIDAIAVTIGPGLIGSLLVGVETAKSLAFAWNKPIIPVNHLFGHLYANWIGQEKEIIFPALGLVISGGHTDLVLMKNHGDLQWLGGTRDDAAGEAFDKVGRMLGFPYPSGPTIEERAKKGNPKAVNFPRPMMGTADYDFSFSGLKTAAFNHIKSIEKLEDETINNLCASLQQAIIDVIVKKTLKAAEEHNVQSILLGGGVAANQTLVENLKLNAKRYTLDADFFVPSKSLCTDNAAMIGAAAFFNDKLTSWKDINANPELYFD